jgi:hypothetical protein
MRPINVTLDSVTWELAKKKSNFSDWVRNQLRSERNRLYNDKDSYIQQLEEEIKELERLKEYWYQTARNLKFGGEEE